MFVGIAWRGVGLFSLACQNDLEGIVAKLSMEPYASRARASTWLKIKNPHYTQAVNRGEWMNRPR